MNTHTLRALFLDAIYQVLDNRVFRVLGVLILLPVAVVFCIGFREEELVLFFGLKTYSYDSLIESFSLSAASIAEARVMLIENTADIIAGFLSGSLGMAVMIAATAFFVPRMLEKGAVETLFHKPVPRLWFFLSRYVAGLVFVALLCTALVSGVYAGFLVSSGYSYGGVFWELPGAVYAFGIVHAVSMAIGVWTRSTPAAILLSIFFFVGNGCVHTAWSMKESFTHDREAAEDSDTEGLSQLLEGLSVALDTAHFILPKPGDAGRMVESLRGNEPQKNRSVRIQTNGESIGDASHLMGWDAAPRYSYVVSLLSTIAFTAGLLFLGWRKLARADL